MNKLCVVARNRETYFIRRLTEEVGDVLFWDPWIGQAPVADNYLVRTTSIYRNDDDLKLLEKVHGKVINPVMAHELLRDKVRQFTFLERRGFHLIPWRRLDGPGDFLPEKVLIKPVRGQGGWGIRTMTAEEFLNWEKTSIDRDWIVQPYLENLRELRLFFCGHEEFLLERSGEVAANFTQGGKAKLVSIPKALSELGDEIRDLTGTSYGAIDLFESGDQHLIIEINPVPGIEQLEKLTGQNIVRKVLSLLKG